MGEEGEYDNVQIIMVIDRVSIIIIKLVKMIHGDINRWLHALDLTASL